jgi:hypothetical protein
VHFGGGTHAPMNGPQIAGIASEFIYVFVEGPPPLEDAEQWQLIPPLEHAPATPMSDLQRRNFLERQGLHMADGDPALETALMTGFVDERIQEPGQRASTRIRARVTVVAPPADNDDDDGDDDDPEAEAEGAAANDGAVDATGDPFSRLTPRPAVRGEGPSSARHGVARLPGDVLISALLSSARATRTHAACPPSGNFATPACAQRRPASRPASLSEHRTSKWALHTSPKQRQPTPVATLQLEPRRLAGANRSYTVISAPTAHAPATGFSLPVISLTAEQAWQAHQRAMQMQLQQDPAATLAAAAAAAAGSMAQAPFPAFPLQFQPGPYGWAAPAQLPWGQHMTRLGSIAMLPAAPVPAPQPVCLTAPPVLSRMHPGAARPVLPVPTTPLPHCEPAPTQQHEPRTAPLRSARPAKRTIDEALEAAHAASAPLPGRQPSTDKRPRVAGPPAPRACVPSWLACSDCGNLLVQAATLPCGHSVCTACAASGLVGKRGPLGCPACGKSLIAAGARLSSVQHGAGFLAACRPCHSLDEAVLALLPTLPVPLQAQHALRLLQHARALKAIIPTPIRQQGDEAPGARAALPRPASGLIVPGTSSLPTSPAEPSPRDQHDSEILIEERQSLRLEDRIVAPGGARADAFGDASSEDSGCESEDDDEEDDDLAVQEPGERPSASAREVLAAVRAASSSSLPMRGPQPHPATIP